MRVLGCWSAQHPLLAGATLNAKPLSFYRIREFSSFAAAAAASRAMPQISFVSPLIIEKSASMLVVDYREEMNETN